MNSKIKKIILLLVLSLIGYGSFSSFSSEISDPSDEELILGTWIHEEDENYKWVFSNNGICKWFQDGELVDEFNYSISHTSPQCGYQVRVPNDLEGTNYSYLRLKDMDDDQAVYCYEIFGVTESGLSINYLGIANIMVFDKQ